MTGLLPECVLERQTKADFTNTYTWHMKQLKVLISGELFGWTADWVEIDKLDHMFSVRKGGRASYGSLPEKLIWNLFACAMVVTREADLSGVE